MTVNYLDICYEFEFFVLFHGFYVVLSFVMFFIYMSAL